MYIYTYIHIYIYIYIFTYNHSGLPPVSHQHVSHGSFGKILFFLPLPPSSAGTLFICYPLQVYPWHVQVPQVLPQAYSWRAQAPPVSHDLIFASLLTCPKSCVGVRVGCGSCVVKLVLGVECMCYGVATFSRID